MKTPRNRTSKTEAGSSRAQRKHSAKNALPGEKDKSSALSRAAIPGKQSCPPMKTFASTPTNLWRYGDSGAQRGHLVLLRSAGVWPMFYLEKEPSAPCKNLKKWGEIL